MMENKILATKLFEVSSESFLLGSPWTKEQLFSFLEGEYNHYFLIEEEQEILGFILLTTIFDEAEVVLIGVNKKNQRQGLAQKLMSQSIDSLKINQVTSLFIEVRETNYPAQQLYLKQGFREIGKRKNYYEQPKEDALIWQLLL